jgi:hypothetical protein
MIEMLRMPGRRNGVLIRLLCFVILSAFLDRIPDPPAIRPNREKVTTIYLSAPSKLPKSCSAEVIFLASVPIVFKFDPPPLAEIEILFFLKHWATLFVVIWHASDSSPPSKSAQPVVL